MSYRLKAGEAVPEGIKRIASEEIASAISGLERKNEKQRDEAIHEARKSLKKIRAALRLVQPELGPVYRAENGRLGDLARKLSELRDNTAIIEVFDGLVDKYRDSLQPGTFAVIRRFLEKNKRDAEQKLEIQKLVRNTLATLHAETKRIGNWPLKKDGFSAISGGLENRYRRGRKAMAIARKNPTPENYHEWRKRVKDHWYHVRLVESMWTGMIQAREGALKDLETWLGDDHNLVVLCDKLQNASGLDGDEGQVRLFLALVDQRQKELRENALSLGARIYNQKPSQLTRDLARLWDAWQHQPQGVKELQKQQREVAKKQPGRAQPAKPRKTAVA